MSCKVLVQTALWLWRVTLLKSDRQSIFDILLSKFSLSCYREQVLFHQKIIWRKQIVITITVHWVYDLLTTVSIICLKSFLIAGQSSNVGGFSSLCQQSFHKAFRRGSLKRQRLCKNIKISGILQKSSNK